MHSESTPPRSSGRERTRAAGQAEVTRKSPVVSSTPPNRWDKLPPWTDEQKQLAAIFAPYFPGGRLHIRILGQREHWTDLLIAREVRRRDAAQIYEQGDGPRTVRSPSWETAPDPLSNRRCRYCGDRAAEVDHVWPRSRGGDDHPNNLVPACELCNGRKSGKSLFADLCPRCSRQAHPSDLETSTGKAFYACRCGEAWSRTWDLQHPPLW